MTRGYVALGDVVADLIADLKLAQAHRATCTTRPCAECRVGPCVVCGADAAMLPSGAVGECAACAATRVGRARLAAAFESIPADLADVDARELRQRATGAEALTAKIELAVGTTARRVVLVGPTGAGKTSLAVAMFRAWLEQRVPLGERVSEADGQSLFVSAFKLNKARAQHPLGQGEAPLIERACNATLVVIDDLGAETGLRDDGVREVLHTRHEDARATWVTTFLTPPQTAAKYGGGIARRLSKDASHVLRLGE